MNIDQAIYILRNTAWLGSNDERDETEQAVEMVIDKLLSAENTQLSGEDATSVCKCPCVYREPCDYCPYRRRGCPAEEGLKDE